MARRGRGFERLAAIRTLNWYASQIVEGLFAGWAAVLGSARGSGADQGIGHDELSGALSPKSTARFRGCMSARHQGQICAAARSIERPDRDCDTIRQIALVHAARRQSNSL